MLRACSLLLLTGCHVVLGLDERASVVDAAVGDGTGPDDRSATHDEDGDGIADRFDLCPHIPAVVTDTDGDGIGNPCDLDPETPGETSLFFSFEGGIADLGAFEALGALRDVGPDAILLGTSDTARSSLILRSVDVDSAHVQVGFRFVDGTLQGLGWSELGVYTVHRAFEPDRKRRGDHCFYGFDSNGSFLELGEDEVGHPESAIRFSNSVLGSSGVLSQVRTPAGVRCIADVSSGRHEGKFDLDDDDRSGAIAITATQMAANLAYVWIVTRP